MTQNGQGHQRGHTAQRGRRAAGRRLPEDGVQGPQRRAVCLGRRAPAGPRRRRGARLPAQPGGPGAGLRADPVDRRGDARHAPCTGRRRCSWASSGRSGRWATRCGVANTIEGDPGGIAGALASLLDQGVDGVVISEPIDEGVGLISVDVPVLVLGAPPTFAAPQVVTARRRRGPARAGRDRAPAGVGARDRPSPGRPAAVVFGTGPSRRLARGAASPRRGRAAGRRGRLVGRVRLRGGPGTGRRRHRDRGVRRERRHGDRSHPRAARGRAPGARGHQRRRVRRHPGRRLRHSPAHHRAAAVRRGRAAGPRAAGTRHREAGRRASTGGRPTGRARRPRLDGATTAPADPGTWAASPMPTVARTVSPPAAKSHPPSPDQRRSVHLRRHVTRGPHRPR